MDFDTILGKDTPRSMRLSRRDWALVVAGLATWGLLAWGGVWLVRQLTHKPEGCASAPEPPTHQAKGTPTGPRNPVQLLTGTGRCP
jgi:hypothetical protein